MITLQDLSIDKIFQPNTLKFGGQTSYAELLLSKFKRVKAVRENKIFDLIGVELDPNFSPVSAFNSSKLQKLVSKLSLSTSLVTMAKAKLKMMKIYEFLPSNILYLMDNYQAFMDTNVNMLENVKQLITFRKIEEAFLADLKLQFFGGELTYKQVMDIANNFYSAFPVGSDIDNISIRSILSLGLQNILPNDFYQFFDSLQWFDILEDVLSEGFESEKEILSELFSESFQSIPTTTNIEDVLSEQTLLSAQTSKLTLSDIFGIDIQNSVKQEVYTYLRSDIETKILSDSRIPTTVSTQQLQELTNQLFDNHVVPTLETDVFSKQSMGLPSISEIVKAINTETYNYTVQSIQSATQRFAIELMNSLGIAYSSSLTTDKPVDYLFNVRRMLKTRLDLSKTGSSSTSLIEIDTYIKSAFGKPSTYTLSQSELEQLEKYIATELKDL